MLLCAGLLFSRKLTGKSRSSWQLLVHGYHGHLSALLPSGCCAHASAGFRVLSMLTMCVLSSADLSANPCESTETKTCTCRRVAKQVRVPLLADADRHQCSSTQVQSGKTILKPTCETFGRGGMANSKPHMDLDKPGICCCRMTMVAWLPQGDYAYTHGPQVSPERRHMEASPTVRC